MGHMCIVAVEGVTVKWRICIALKRCYMLWCEWQLLNIQIHQISRQVWCHVIMAGTAAVIHHPSSMPTEHQLPTSGPAVALLHRLQCQHVLIGQVVVVAHRPLAAAVALRHQQRMWWELYRVLHPMKHAMMPTSHWLIQQCADINRPVTERVVVDV